MPQGLSNKTPIARLGEIGLIKQIEGMCHSHQTVIQGIGDDTAVVSYLREKFLLLTTDMMYEGVHFKKTMPARGIGHKAIASSISDIAAMGGVPKYALVSIGISSQTQWGFIRQLYQGMNTTAKKYHVRIIGGDTIKSDRLVFNVTIVGEVNKNKCVTRAGAKHGDQIFVTGPLGKSLSSGKHLAFTPRIQEARYLTENFKPTAMIDVGHILRESKVGAVIHEEKIPKRPKASLKNALFDGEDYELIFTLSKLHAQKLLQQKQKVYSFYHVGEIIKGHDLQVLDRKGNMTKIPQQAYQHF